ncbi:hypothetical protein M2165_000374 [Variovorax sp. TBS-050B]|uniref:hypothetical protein n=1 Tax=Variovorax sp. TBS-050B TaxID=2940551 RepID=UPI0024735E22|nr:hypothetical protein [Variovorax sp. TBS-050B]MDH6590485.1 hypothetical protein [Variovorax sp. TBS-050B]
MRIEQAEELGRRRVVVGRMPRVRREGQAGEEDMRMAVDRARFAVERWCRWRGSREGKQGVPL